VEPLLAEFHDSYMASRLGNSYGSVQGTISGETGNGMREQLVKPPGFV
jgi:hypothetical protein